MLLHSSAGIRPKWGIVDSDKGPGFKNTTFLNNISYFTDIDTVSPERPLSLNFGARLRSIADTASMT